MAKGMIISVGGSIKPLIFSLNTHQPEGIVFFASRESREIIPQIIQSLNFTPKRMESIVVELPENFKACLNKLIQELPAKLPLLEASPEELIVDYTGGTKSMSVALVLATIEHGTSFSYIGGKRRNKEGLGVVIDGEENAYFLNNPWEELAYQERKKINLLFNTARYRTARERVEYCLERVPDSSKPFFSALKVLLEGYYLWDNFKYSSAQYKLNKGWHDFKLICSHLPENHTFFSLLSHIEQNAIFLEKIGDGHNIILDLVANACRRARLENKYDDAIVRLYRTLEKRAELELKLYGLEASDVKLDLVPPSLRENLKEKYFNRSKNKIMLPLYGSYEVLRDLERENGTENLGHKFFACKKEINQIIDLRNSSILTHGTNTLDEHKFNQAHEVIINFLDIKEENLPSFPKLAI